MARAQTNYPAEATIEVRDQNGNLVTEVGVFVNDPLDTFASGWAPLVDIQVTWFSDPIDLGKYKTDSKGELRFNFLVPNAPPVPGVHTLRLEGLGANGQFRRVDSAIKVNPRNNGTTPTTVQGGNGNGNGNNGNGNGNGGGNGNGSSVLGRTQTNNGNGNGNLAFGKTGAELFDLGKIGFTLVAVGAVLFLAVRKRSTVPA